MIQLRNKKCGQRASILSGIDSLFDSRLANEKFLPKSRHQFCVTKTQTQEGASDRGTADCYRLETAIWDDLLNENYKSLAADLDDEQKAKLRDMQRAWIAYRDSTCGFYYTKIQGTMAAPMGAACAARETARRAVLLKFFSSL